MNEGTNQHKRVGWQLFEGTEAIANLITPPLSLHPTPLTLHHPTLGQCLGS